MASARRFTNEEVTEIVRRALSAPDDASVSYDDLVEIADSSGISRDRLEKAIREQEERGEFEDAKREWLQKHRREFKDHLQCYLVSNGILFLIDVFTGPGMWVHNVLIGWGIGLAIHASGVIFVKQEKIEQGARKVLKRRRLSKVRDDLQKYGDLGDEFNREFDSLVERHSS